MLDKRNSYLVSKALKTFMLVTVLLKDDGRPFNPLLGASDSMDHLGLRLVNGLRLYVGFIFVH